MYCIYMYNFTMSAHSITITLTINLQHAGAIISSPLPGATFVLVQVKDFSCCALKSFPNQLMVVMTRKM